MMNKWCELSVVMLMLTLNISAQETDTSNTYDKNIYADAVQLWRSTMNPAGLTRDSLMNRGTAYFDFCHKEGSHHLVQDGNKENRLGFYADSYQTIGKYLYGYGRFNF